MLETEDVRSLINLCCCIHKLANYKRSPNNKFYKAKRKHLVGALLSRHKETADAVNGVGSGRIRVCRVARNRCTTVTDVTDHMARDACARVSHGHLLCAGSLNYIRNAMPSKQSETLGLVIIFHRFTL